MVSHFGNTRGGRNFLSATWDGRFDNERVERLSC
jgi:hypothetical protein